MHNENYAIWSIYNLYNVVYNVAKVSINVMNYTLMNTLSSVSYIIVWYISGVKAQCGNAKYRM